VIVHRGRILDDIVGAVAVGHFVLALLHGHRLDPRHGRHIARVELVELGHPVQNAGQLGLQPRGLVVGDGDAGKAGDTADCSAVDGHGSVLGWRGSEKVAAFL
jgi:hypothetical protein